MSSDPRSFAASLPCWSGRVDPEPLLGGLSNTSFVVRDRGARFVVRVGADIPVHHVVRATELAVSRAAAAAGLSPEVVFAAPNALVLRYVEGGRSLTSSEIVTPALLERLVPLVRGGHREVSRHVRGPAPFFWVFHVVRDYAATLREGRSRSTSQLDALLEKARVLEAFVGPIDVVFGHNDLLPANIIDDGTRLWLIDWEYGGYNSPLFDLGGLASNAQLPPDLEEHMLELYFERRPDADLLRRYRAMKCASLLREAMWSMVSEIHSTLSFDFGAYTEENLARFERADAELSRG